MKPYTYTIGYPYVNPITLTVKATDAWDALDKVLDKLQYEKELDLAMVTDVNLNNQEDY